MYQKQMLLLILLPVLACNTSNTPPIQAQATQAAEIISAPENSKISYNTYCNARFGFCVEYPGDLLYPQPESDNGDGRIFKNKQGDEILRASGIYNLGPDGEHIPIEDVYTETLDMFRDKTITYSKCRSNFFVITGYDNGTVFYQKSILRDHGEILATALLHYPEKDRKIYDLVSRRVFKTFR